jgi:VWFA-related protein
MQKIKAKKTGKKVLFLTAAIMFFSLINPGFSQEENRQKTIVEKVEVNWWQVPIFALDKQGSPILNLKDTDIEVWVNGRRIEAFTFYKREFIVSQSVQQEAVDSQQPTEIPKEKAPRVLKSQSIFLVFDVAVSGQRCTKRSKDIARKIVTGAGPGVQFTVLTIEPFKGLNYICGPTADKKELLDSIDKKVIGKPNDRIVDTSKFFASSNNDETGGMEQQVAAYYLKKAEGFFNSFESLYLVFNSIEDNKFVYFFTQGISKSIVEKIRAEKTRYRAQLKNAAESLGRGGAVLFIVNPMGVSDASDLVTRSVNANSNRYAGSTKSYFDREEDLSGEKWLRYMAEESGGKYLEGMKEKIATSLEQMHRAYYEISFPDIPQLKGTTREITIKPKRKGIFIHSLRSLEKSKTYPEMNEAEKEILALNLISQNSLLKTKLSTQPARVTQIKKHKKSIAYTILLPKAFLNQQLDVYKFWVKDDREVINLETTSLQTGKRKIKLQFKKKKNQAPGLKPYFALVNGTRAAALVRAIGHEWVDPQESRKKLQPSNLENISAVELQDILNHAAEYCEKIKQSAFHFFCKEKIVESWKSLFSVPDLTRKLNSVAQKPDLIEQLGTLIRRYKRMKIEGDVKTVMNKYTFTYRLIKSGTEIKEERDWFSSKDNIPISRDQVIKPTVFFSEKAVFAPLTILAQERQQMYDFRLIRYDKRKGRPAVVIEAIPKNNHDQQEYSIYGKVWIDEENYSVLGIEADPRSIKGYQALKEIGERLNARLNLTLEIEFDQLHNGIRFPTKVHMLEKYKGGPHVLTLKGHSGWERNRTTFTYKDYQFFDVKVEVSIDK